MQSYNSAADLALIRRAYDFSAQMHAEGRRIFTWTLDVPIRVREYVEARTFDGILSNYPSLVAYNHDVLQ